MKFIKQCRVCNSGNIKKFFDLGLHPFSEGYLKDPKKEKKYPLSLSWCSECSLVQLNETADPRDLFSNFFWVTGTSKVANDFSEVFYKELEKRTDRKKNGYVLEVASNDGTFLKPFLNNGYSVLGIDPAENIFEIAKKNEIPTLVDFWGENVAEKVISEKGKAKIVFARNVVPHVANLHSFINGLKKILRPDGILAIEVHYGKIILEKLHYDSIYHAHLCYFTIKSLEKLLNIYDLHIFDILESPINDGAVVVYAGHNKTEQSVLLKKYKKDEETNKTNDFISWSNFAERSILHKKQLISLLREVVDGGNRIIAYGASARSSTLFNFCGIDSNVIQVIADKNKLKYGYYTPGSHMLIVSPEEAMKEKPDFVFVSAWNFSKEIKEYLSSEFCFRGSYLVPLPDFPRIEQ